MTACRYFDGRSSRVRQAVVESVGSRLAIVGDGVDRVVEIGDLDFSPALDRGPARIAIAGGALCEFDDRDAAHALFERLGWRAPRADRIASRTRHVVVIVAAFVAVMAALYVWGIPWGADLVVAYAPPRWQEALGDRVLETLDEQKLFRPSEMPEARRDALVARYAALRLPADDRAGATFAAGPEVAAVIEFRRFGVPNAVALPGRRIVVADELIALAPDDDAILTVLAHETGHLVHRDAMRQLVRATMTSLVAAWYFGDASTAAATVAGGIGSLSYSRDAEHAADLYAVAMMAANERSTRSAAELFRRLEGWRPPASKGGKDAKADAKDRERGRERLRVPAYLSTHPDTDERIELFERGAPTPTAAPR